MVIEISPKQKFAMSPLIIVGAVICLILAVFCLASYFYFDFKIKKISQEIEEKGKEVFPVEEAIQEKEKEILPIKEKINDFDKLLSRHKGISNIFNFLERVCLPNVWFSSFDLNSDQRQVSLSGETDSFTTLEHQIFVLKQESLLENTKIFEVSVNEEGGINFTLNLTFTSEIFKLSI